MKLTSEQQYELTSKLDLILDAAAHIKSIIETGVCNPKFQGDDADQLIDWSTQLSESLYDIETSEGNIPTGNQP